MGTAPEQYAPVKKETWSASGGQGEIVVGKDINNSRLYKGDVSFLVLYYISSTQDLQ